MLRYLFIIAIWFATSLRAQDFPVQRCVNLDNGLEAPQEGLWGYSITQRDLDWIANQGFDSVRLPVRFHNRWNGKIDPVFLARVDQVIRWAMDRDLHVILDLHHFDPLSRDPATYGDMFVDIWTELSGHYAGYDNRLMFELLNEPNGALTTALAQPLYDKAIAIIRRDHPTRWIITEGGNWAALDALFDLPDPGPYHALSFHYYSPFEFTHQQATWLEAPPPARDWGTPQEIANVKDDIAYAASRNVPLLLSEFGVTSQTDLRHRAHWISTVRAAAERQGIGWCHWGFAAGFHIYDVQSGDWEQPLKDALIPSFNAD